VVETERNLFLGRHIITLLPTTHIKLNTVVHAKSHCFSLVLSKPFAFIHHLLHLTTFYSTMSGEADQVSNVVDDIPATRSQSVVGVESKAASSTSSSTMAN
jgi:hypothetical protein